MAKAVNSASKFKHPALAHQTMLKDLETYDENNQQSLPGWETFTPEQKNVLAALPWHASIADALRFVRKDPDTNTNAFMINARRKPGFMDAATQRKRFSTSIVRNMIADLEGMAAYRLMFYLTSEDVSDVVRIKAMEMVMRLQGEVENGKAPMPGGFVNYGDVTIVQTQQNLAQGIDHTIAIVGEAEVDSP